MGLPSPSPAEPASLPGGDRLSAGEVSPRAVFEDVYRRTLDHVLCTLWRLGINAHDLDERAAAAQTRSLVRDLLQTVAQPLRIVLILHDLDDDTMVREARGQP